MPVALKSFCVSGRGPFPMDMLRYDSAWPEQTEDAYAIASSYADDPGIKWEINLLSSDRMAPTARRWDSFNCKVFGA